MKKLILTLAMVMTVFVASATSVRYFTRPQAYRVANALDAQNELMIYCGYEYELATYVIVNEVWTERVNSKYYEIWLYGYDAYTGEEIYMPIDLACIWLYNPYSGRMYSAAQYLRFRSTVATPNFYWTMPPYNPFTRHFHDPHFNHGYTYHYEIHRFGWRPPMPPHGGPWPYHPYYMRTPHTPAPVPVKPFTPGLNYPQTPDGHGYIGGGGRTTIGTRSTNFNNAGGARSGNNMNNSGNPGTTNRNSSTNTGSSNGRGSGTVNNGSSNGRGNNTVNTGSSNGRGNNTVNTGSSNGRGNNTVNTGSSNGRGNNTVNTGSSNGRGNSTVNTGSSNGRGNSTVNTGSSNGRGNSTVNTGSSNGRGNSTVNTGSSNGRGTGTVNSGTSNNRGTTTNTGSTNRGNTTGTSTNGRNSTTTNRGSNPTR